MVKLKMERLVTKSMHEPLNTSPARSCLCERKVEMILSKTILFRGAHLLVTAQTILSDHILNGRLKSILFENMRDCYKEKSLTNT